ncbi:MAG TPA: hypothetical protein ENJ15_04325 [Caldithrix abyssi]|uniref:Carotenoid 1,2-hydratase n=1 Tax=Caldithrix abyssi TaxID=187145 RepID=A0A7V5VEX7_CALAY|nr:hypothetical protein [Caldithrix abyssi]
MSCISNFHWYYFDLHSADGYDLICTIHPAPFNSVFDIAIIDIYLYNGAETLVHHFFVVPQKELRRSEDPFVLELDKHNFIRKSGGHILVRIRDGETCGLTLELNDPHPLKQPVRSDILPGGAGEESFEWVVHTPYAPATAELKFSGKTHILNGLGYHDYNGGSINLKQSLRYWFWGKYYLRDSLIVYGYIQDRYNNSKKLLLRADKEGTAIDRRAEVEADKHRLRYKGPLGEYDFSVEPAQLLDRVDFFMPAVKAPLFLIKLLEVGAHFSGRIKFLKPLNRFLTNSVYKRYRSRGTDQKGRALSCFYEEMYF